MSGTDRFFRVEWTNLDAQIDYENNLRRLVSHRLVNKDTDLTALGFLRAHKISPDAILDRRDFDPAFYDEYRDYLMEVQGHGRSFGGPGRTTFLYPNEYASSADVRRFPAHPEPDTSYALSSRPMSTGAVAKAHGEASPKQYLDEAYRRISGDPLASEQTGATKKKLLSLQKWATAQTRKPELRAAVLASGAKNRPGSEGAKGLSPSELDPVVHEGARHPPAEFARGVSLRARERGSKGPFADVGLCAVLSNPSGYEYEDSSQASIVRSLSDDMSRVCVLTESGPVTLSEYVAAGCPAVHPVRTYGEPAPASFQPKQKGASEEVLRVEDRRRAPYRTLSFPLSAFCALQVGAGFVKRVDQANRRGYILPESQAASHPKLVSPEDYACRRCADEVGAEGCDEAGSCLSCLEHRGSPKCLGCCQCDATSPYQRVKGRLSDLGKQRVRRLHSRVNVTLLDTETGALIQAPLDEYEILYPRTRYAVVSAPLGEEEKDRPTRDFSPLRTEGLVDWAKQQYRTRFGDAPPMTPEEYGEGSKILLDVWTNAGFLPGHRFEGMSKLTPEQRIDRLSERDQALLAKELAFIARGLEGKLEGVVDDGTDFGDVLAQSAVPTSGKAKGGNAAAPSSMDRFHKELQRLEIDRRTLPDREHPPPRVSGEELERIAQDEDFMKAFEKQHPLPTSAFSFNADTGIHRRYTTDPATGQTHRSYTWGLPRVAANTTHLGGADVGGGRPFLATGGHDAGGTSSHTQFMRWLFAKHPEVAKSTSSHFLVLVPSDRDFRTTQVAENWEHFVFLLESGSETPLEGVIADLSGSPTDLLSLDYLRPKDRAEVSRLLQDLRKGGSSNGPRVHWFPLQSLQGLFE